MTLIKKFAITFLLSAMDHVHVCFELFCFYFVQKSQNWQNAIETFKEAKAIGEQNHAEFPPRSPIVSVVSLH